MLPAKDVPQGEKKDSPGQSTSQQSTSLPSYELSAFSGPSARLPAFYKTNPSLWFIQAEAVFATSRVTSPQIKFQAVIAGLELEVLTQVADILSTADDDPYATLKARLITIYGESEYKRIHRLLENTQLGDQRPSQLYRQMLQLAGTTMTKETVTHLWLRNLPPRVQEILQATRQEDVDALTTVADKIMEVERPTEVYAAAQPSSREETSRPSNSAIYEELKRLRAEVAELRLGRSRSQERRGPNRPTSRSTSRGRTLCYFHRRFRQKARKCVQPCDWKPKPPTLN